MILDTPNLNCFKRMLFHYKVSLAFFFFLLSHVTCSNLCRVDPEQSKLCTRLFCRFRINPTYIPNMCETGTRKNLDPNFSKFWPNVQILAKFCEFFGFHMI